MSSWWLALIQYGSSGALGAAGAVVAQKVAARREDSRWSRDGIREEQRWTREDRHRWVAERQKVFAEYLTIANAWRAHVRHLRYSPEVSQPGPPSDTLLVDAERLITQMELLGSPKVSQAARGLWVWIAGAVSCIREPRRTDENKNTFMRGVNSTYEELLRTMRLDLGLPNSESIHARIRQDPLEVPGEASRG